MTRTEQKYEERLDDFDQHLKYVHVENDECHYYGCVIHSPSDHVLSHLPRFWSNDLAIMVRVDDDGEWWVDPDEIAYRIRHPDHPYRPRIGRLALKGGDDDTQSLDIPAWEKARTQAGRGEARRDNLRLPLARRTTGTLPQAREELSD